MPDATPIYGFPFPCPGETVGPAAFANLANAIDTKLLDLRTQEFNALHRPGTAQVVNNFNIALGVETVLTGAGSSYTLPTGGVYIVSATFTGDGGFFPGVTGVRFRVRQNAVIKFASNVHTPNSGSSPTVTASGPIVGAAGDVLTFAATFTGTDATMDVDLELTVRMIVRIP